MHAELALIASTVADLLDHIAASCGRSSVKTSSKKLRSKFTDLKEWLRHNLTQPIDEVWKSLNSKLREHYQCCQETAKRFAYRWICRRSQKGRISLREYGECLKRNPLAGPSRLSDPIAKGRTLPAAMHR